MPINHKKRYTKQENLFMDSRVLQYADKAAMYADAPTVAKQLDRTVVAVCKQFEKRRGWFWAAK